jgi:predicted GIY-YIG superfamily endonuclease
MAWTYLVECSDGSFYVGSTTDLDLRIAQHNDGGVSAYTRTRRPVILLWAAELETIPEAYALERRLHGWSRAKKLALARGDFTALPLLSSRSRAGRVAREEAQEIDRALRDGP